MEQCFATKGKLDMALFQSLVGGFDGVVAFSLVSFSISECKKQQNLEFYTSGSRKLVEAFLISRQNM